jgi:hypothetical protein
MSAAEIACTVDPLAYVSRLSAMEMHGFTDRVAQVLLLSSPHPTAWKEHALRQMQSDRGEALAAYLKAAFPRLVRITHLGAFRRTPASEVRAGYVLENLCELRQFVVRRVADSCRPRRFTRTRGC